MLSFPKWMNVKSLVITGKNGIWNTKNSPYSVVHVLLSLVLRIWRFITTSLSWWFSLFPSPVCLTMYRYCNEKTDVDRLFFSRNYAGSMGRDALHEKGLERDKGAHQSLLVHTPFLRSRSRGWTLVRLKEKRPNASSLRCLRSKMILNQNDADRS